MKEWVNYNQVFKKPEGPEPPTDYENLSQSSHHPNLNSLEYRLHPSFQQQILLPNFDFVLDNGDGLFFLATNDVSSRIWSSCLAVFNSLESLQTHRAEEAFLFPLKSTITSIKSPQPDMLLCADIAGDFRVLNVQGNAKSENIKDLWLHDFVPGITGPSAITSMDSFRADPAKAVTGSKMGTLQVLDVPNLTPVATRRFAHTEAISGVSTSQSCPDTFVTCSSDRSILLWDERNPRPAIGLFEGHKFDYSTIYWTSDSENGGLVYAGDWGGRIQIIDPRKPREVVSSTKVSPFAVKSFHVRGNKVQVCCDSKKTEVYEATEGTLKKVFETEEPAFISSGHWLTDSELMVTGWDYYIKTHKLVELNSI